MNGERSVHSPSVPFASFTSLPGLGSAAVAAHAGTLEGGRRELVDLIGKTTGFDNHLEIGLGVMPVSGSICGHRRATVLYHPWQFGSDDDCHSRTMWAPRRGTHGSPRDSSHVPSSHSRNWLCQRLLRPCLAACEELRSSAPEPLRTKVEARTSPEYLGMRPQQVSSACGAGRIMGSRIARRRYSLGWLRVSVEYVSTISAACARTAGAIVTRHAATAILPCTQ